MKIVPIILLAIIGLLLLVVIAAVCGSRVIYGRSLIATIAEHKLRGSGEKKKLVDPTACAEYVEKITAEGAKPYYIPKSVVFDVSVAEHKKQDMQVFFLNEDCLSDTLLFYLPGGAYINDPIAPHWNLCNTLAKDLNLPVIVPIYPKLPVNTWKNAYASMTELYRSCTDEAGFKKIVLMGDSAGAGLALGLAQELRGTDARQPDQLILLSPWVDVSMDNREMEQYEDKDPLLGIYGLRVAGERWADKLDVHDPKVSPIYGAFHDLGRIALFVGTRELFYPDVLRLSEKLNQSGVRHELFVGKGLNHVYPVFPIPEARKAVEQIKRIIAY